MPPLATRNLTTCPFCGLPGEVHASGLSDVQQGLPGLWSFRECGVCDVAWLDPRPLDQSLPDLYPRGYYTHDQTALPSGWHSRFKNAPPGRILDVGCGNGGDLAALRAKGWTAIGLEPDALAAANARRAHGLEIVEKSLGDRPFPAGHFDAIVLHHVIEHVPDPERDLAECARLLKPGGILLLATPNRASLGHSLFGNDWFGLDVPRHFVLFSIPGLQRLVARSGLTIISARTTRHWAMVTWINSGRIRREGILSEHAPTTITGQARLIVSAVAGALFELLEACLCRFLPLGEELEVTAKAGNGPDDSSGARKPGP